MQPVTEQPLVTVTKPHGAHGDGVKHRSIFVLARRRRKLSRYMRDLLAAYTPSF